MSAGGVTYTYDVENTRIATTENGKTTEYVTDTGGSLSKLLVAYESDGSETSYYYGAEGLAGQYNSKTKEGLFYHFDNIGSTTAVTNALGIAVAEFAYGTYGELLSTVEKGIRFLYNGAYGVATDSNGLYYMRARYYNPDIKRFINQDIKVGDIGSSQSLNRYAYCEGNPVSLIDPFGLSPEASQEQTEKSKYQWLHTILDVAGLVIDAADIVNAAIYAMEGDWKNAALCAVTAIPMVGAAIVGVAKCAKAAVKAKKAAKIAELAAESSKLTKNAANSLDIFTDTMKATTKYGDNPFKLADGITTNRASDTMRALETGGDWAKQSQKTAQEMKAVANGDIFWNKTSLQEGSNIFKTGYGSISGGVGTGVKSGAIKVGKYSKTYYEGTTKVGGQLNDISRTVYQRNDIDWNRIDPATGLTNKELAQGGLAPYANDGSKIELHHLLQKEPGPMVELPASLHDKYYKTLHGLVGDGGSFRNNPDLEKQYNNFRAKYWRWRAKNLQE